MNRDKAFVLSGWLLAAVFISWGAANVHMFIVDQFKISSGIAWLLAISAEVLVVFLGYAFFIIEPWFFRVASLVLQVSVALASIFLTHSTLLKPSQERTKELQIAEARVIRLKGDVERYTFALNAKEEPLQQVCSPMLVGDKVVTKCTYNTGDKNRIINNEALRAEKKQILTPNPNGLNGLEQARNDLAGAIAEIAEIKKVQEQERGGLVAFIFSAIPQIGNVFITMLLNLTRRKRRNNDDTVTGMHIPPKPGSRPIREYLNDAKKLAPTLSIYQKPISEHFDTARAFLTDILDRVIFVDKLNPYSISHYLDRAKEQFNSYWEKKDPDLNTSLLTKIFTTSRIYKQVMKDI